MALGARGRRNESQRATDGGEADRRVKREGLMIAGAGDDYYFPGALGGASGRFSAGRWEAERGAAIDGLGRFS